MDARFARYTQCRAIVGDDVVDVVLIVFGKNRLQPHPIGNFVLRVFLKKEIVIDAVGISL